MEKRELKKIEDVLEGARSAAVIGHVRPDGDCVGSCLAVYHYVRRLLPEARVQVYLQPFPQSFDFLEGAELVDHTWEEDVTYDVCFAVDCADANRMGDARIYFDTAKTKVCIDHHVTNPLFGEWNQVQPESSSTCEILYGLMDEERIDSLIAECLYLGIVHDTGVFRHSCTSEETMKIAGRLMTKGARSTYIINETHDKKTFGQNKVLGRVLNSAKLWLDGRFIAGVAAAADVEEFGLSAPDLDGIVDQLRITEGVEVALFLHELGPNHFKASLRATGSVDVSRIALKYGGGGHVKAAGCNVSGNWEEIAEEISLAVAEALERG